VQQGDVEGYDDYGWEHRDDAHVMAFGGSKTMSDEDRQESLSRALRATREFQAGAAFGIPPDAIPEAAMGLAGAALAWVDEHRAPAPTEAEWVDAVARIIDPAAWDGPAGFSAIGMSARRQAAKDVAERLAALRPPTPSVSAAEVERLCEVMHDAYEAAAVEQGWQTQERSRKPWSEVPEANKATMRAAVTALIDYLEAR